MNAYDLLTARHRELIAAVNNASTAAEHDRAEAYLRGWRDGVGRGVESWDGGWMSRLDWTDADMHHGGSDAERPMCIGVFLDWSPKVTEAEGLDEARGAAHSWPIGGAL